MYLSLEELDKISKLAMEHPDMHKLVKDWNEARDYGEQDMLLCQLFNRMKELENPTSSDQSVS